MRQIGSEGMWFEVTEESGEVGEPILGPQSLKLQGHSSVREDTVYVFCAL